MSCDRRQATLFSTFDIASFSCFLWSYQERSPLRKVHRLLFRIHSTVAREITNIGKHKKGMGSDEKAFFCFFLFFSPFNAQAIKIPWDYLSTKMYAGTINPAHMRLILRSFCPYLNIFCLKATLDDRRLKSKAVEAHKCGEPCSQNRNSSRID